MKKLLTYLIITTIFITGYNIVFAEEYTPNDIENHWAKDSIKELMDKKIIKGYPDGTFKPNDKMKRVEFLVLILKSLGYELEPHPVYWAWNYVEKGREIGIISYSEFDHDTTLTGFVRNYQYFGLYKNPEKGAIEILEKPLTRQVAANMISDAEWYTYTRQNESIQGIRTIHRYTDQIADIVKTNDNYKASVTYAYSQGIMKGYPDGEFKPFKEATRAEASTILLNFIDKSGRTVPEPSPFKITIGDHDAKLLQTHGNDYEVLNIYGNELKVSPLSKEEASLRLGRNGFVVDYPFAIQINEIKFYKNGDIHPITGEKIDIGSVVDGKGKFLYRGAFGVIDYTIKNISDKEQMYMLSLYKRAQAKESTDYQGPKGWHLLSSANHWLSYRDYYGKMNLQPGEEVHLEDDFRLPTENILAFYIEYTLTADIDEYFKIHIDLPNEAFDKLKGYKFIY